MYLKSDKLYFTLFATFFICCLKHNCELITIPRYLNSQKKNRLPVEVQNSEGTNGSSTSPIGLKKTKVGLITLVAPSVSSQTVQGRCFQLLDVANRGQQCLVAFLLIAHHRTIGSEVRNNYFQRWIQPMLSKRSVRISVNKQLNNYRGFLEPTLSRFTSVK